MGIVPRNLHDRKLQLAMKPPDGPSFGERRPRDRPPLFPVSVIGQTKEVSIYAFAAVARALEAHCSAFPFGRLEEGLTIIMQGQNTLDHDSRVRGRTGAPF